MSLCVNRCVLRLDIVYYCVLVGNYCVDYGESRRVIVIHDMLKPIIVSPESRNNWLKPFIIALFLVFP